MNTKMTCMDCNYYISATEPNAVCNAEHAVLDIEQAENCGDYFYDGESRDVEMGVSYWWRYGNIMSAFYSDDNASNSVNAKRLIKPHGYIIEGLKVAYQDLYDIKYGWKIKDGSNKFYLDLVGGSAQTRVSIAARDFLEVNGVVTQEISYMYGAQLVESILYTDLPGIRKFIRLMPDLINIDKEDLES
jgi:hypothetical protein